MDLEGLARHFGSAFGNLHRHAQPTSEHFRNLLAEALSGLDPHRRIWVENESRRIGNVHVPEPFYKRMIACPALEMLRSMEDRVTHLVGMYGDFDTVLLRHAFEAIQTELGGPETREALAALEVKDLATAARIALEYYDRTYEHGLQKRAKDNRHPVDAQGVSLEQCLELLVRPERLGAAQLFHCGACGGNREATKQLSVQKLPPVLCLHIKRFEHSLGGAGGRAEGRKLDTHVAFPLQVRVAVGSP